MPLDFDILKFISLLTPKSWVILLRRLYFCKAWFSPLQNGNNNSISYTHSWLGLNEIKDVQAFNNAWAQNWHWIEWSLLNKAIFIPEIQGQVTMDRLYLWGVTKYHHQEESQFSSKPGDGENVLGIGPVANGEPNVTQSSLLKLKCA